MGGFIFVWIAGYTGYHKVACWVTISWRNG
ncbi:hypothetical protein ACHAW6_000098 [Cyclotella cf. meneghiniana]